MVGDSDRTASGKGRLASGPKRKLAGAVPARRSDFRMTRTTPAGGLVAEVNSSQLRATLSSETPIFSWSRSTPAFGLSWNLFHVPVGSDVWETMRRTNSCCDALSKTRPLANHLPEAESYRRLGSVKTNDPGAAPKMDPKNDSSDTRLMREPNGVWSL